MASDCGWTCGCAGKIVKSLQNTCHIWALLRWWCTTKRRYIVYGPLPFNDKHLAYWQNRVITRVLFNFIWLTLYIIYN